MNKAKISYGDICLVDPMNEAKQKRYGIVTVIVIGVISKKLLEGSVYRCFNPDSGTMTNISGKLLYPINAEGLNAVADNVVIRFDDGCPEICKADIIALDKSASLIADVKLRNQLQKLATKLNYYQEFCRGE